MLGNYEYYLLRQNIKNTRYIRTSVPSDQAILESDSDEPLLSKDDYTEDFLR